MQNIKILVCLSAVSEAAAYADQSSACSSLYKSVNHIWPVARNKAAATVIDTGLSYGNGPPTGKQAREIATPEAGSTSLLEWGTISRHMAASAVRLKHLKKGSPLDIPPRSDRNQIKCLKHWEIDDLVRACLLAKSPKMPLDYETNFCHC